MKLNIEYLNLPELLQESPAFNQLFDYYSGSQHHLTTFMGEMFVDRILPEIFQCYLCSDRQLLASVEEVVSLDQVYLPFIPASKIETPDAVIIYEHRVDTWYYSGSLLNFHSMMIINHSKQQFLDKIEKHMRLQVFQ